MGKQILQVQFEGQWGKEIRPCFLISKSYFNWGISPQWKLYPLLSLPRCGQAFVPGRASFLSLLLFSEKLGFKAGISTAECTLELISNTPHLSAFWLYSDQPLSIKCSCGKCHTVFEWRWAPRASWFQRCLTPCPPHFPPRAQSSQHR